MPIEPGRLLTSVDGTAPQLDFLSLSVLVANFDDAVVGEQLAHQPRSRGRWYDRVEVNRLDAHGWPFLRQSFQESRDASVARKEVTRRWIDGEGAAKVGRAKDRRATVCSSSL